MSQATLGIAERLVDLEVPSEVRISPSGEHVVYSLTPVGQKGEHKVSAIWTAQIGHAKSARQLTWAASNDRMPQWSPNGESVAFLSDRSGRGKNCAIYVLPIDSGEAQPFSNIEREQDISALAWSPDGDCIAFLSPDEKTADQKAREEKKDDVIVYEKYTGRHWDYNRLRVLDLTSRDERSYNPGDTHVKAFAWDEDSKEIAYVLQDTPEEDSAHANGVSFETISIEHFENLSFEHKSRHKITGFPGTIHGPLLWLNQRLYFLAGTNPAKCSTSLEVYNVSSKSKDWLEYPHNDQGACVVGLCRNGPLTTIKVESGLSDQIYLLNTNPHGQNELLLSCNHEMSSWDAVLTADGDYVLAIVKSSVSSPREVYSYRICCKQRRVKGVVQLSQHSHCDAWSDLGSPQELHCTSSDGTTDLDGLFLASTKVSTEPEHNGERIPTVVLIHGGPYSRVIDSFNTPNFFWSPLLLASSRYGILLPNYRGGSSHGESFARHARCGMGTVDYDDIITLVDEGIKRGLVDPEQIIAGGWSQGGFLSYLLAVRRNSQNDSGSSWKIKAAICGAGITDWDMMAMTSDLPRFEAELAGAAPWAIGQVKGKHDTTARRGSAIWEMKGQKIPPILILHGEEDKTVPVTQAVAFRRGCQYYGIPFEMAVYPREGHIMKERAHLIDMLMRVRRFTIACFEGES